MTVVHVHLTVPQRGTTTRLPTKGLLNVSLYHRTVEGDQYVLTPYFSQVLVDGQTDLYLTPSSPGNAWVVEERVPGGRTRFVTVPDTTQTVNYVDLTEVAPGTLDPYPALGSAYADLAARVSSLEAQVAALQAGNTQPGTVTADASNPGYLVLSGSGVTEAGGVVTLNSPTVTESNGVVTIG